MTICCVDGCNKETYSDGERINSKSHLTTKYCRKHYTWLETRGSLKPTKFSQGTLIERFERRLAEIEKPNDDCWIWIFAHSGKGYGCISETINGREKTKLAHRVSYQYHHGDLAETDLVLHSCDNPSCINPSHLRKGNGSENIKEAYDKGRKIQPILFGENNPRSKLTLEHVKFIKANPQIRHTELALMFGVKPNTIRGVRIGRTWKET
jgi:hypothetical protein